VKIDLNEDEPKPVPELRRRQPGLTEISILPLMLLIATDDRPLAEEHRAAVDRGS
jgi:hypothetical protein